MSTPPIPAIPVRSSTSLRAPVLLPEGLRDRLPPQAQAASRVTRALIDVLRSHGYQRVAPPLAEFQETLSASGGSSRGSESNDKSDRNLLRFTDPVSQRTLALRPDITRQIGRIASTLLGSVPRPLRLCYAGQVVNLRSGQLRPAREMLQVGAELIGSDGVEAAGEIITIAIEALKAADIGPITVDFTLPDAIETLAKGPLPLADDLLDEVRDALDAKDAGVLAHLGAQAYLPLLRATGHFSAAIANLRRFDRDAVLAERITALETIAAKVGDQATLTLDPTERHGLTYQSWFGFSLFVAGQGEAISRGGTYSIAPGHTPGHTRSDEKSEAAVGFSLYPDPLIDDGLGHEDDCNERLFLPLGHDTALASRLRAKGWKTIAALTPQDDGVALGCGYRLGSDGPRLDRLSPDDSRVFEQGD